MKITFACLEEKMKNNEQGILIAVCLLFLVHQIFYAAMDQTFFGEQPIPPTSSVVEDLKREYTSWKHVEGTNWQARFNHLLNYGAGMLKFCQLLEFHSTFKVHMVS